MNAVDASDHFDKPSQEQSPSLLSIILDTNPAAWSLLSPTLSFSSAIANLLVFINAHLAANYTNKVAVIASHCDKAQWLYPSPTHQKLPSSRPSPSQKHQPDRHRPQHEPEPAKRLKLNLKPPPSSTTTSTTSTTTTSDEGNKYRPFRLVEEELLHNLTTLLSTTTPDSVSSTTSTMIAGALTLALSHINRESILHAESMIGASSTTTGTAAPDNTTNTTEAVTTNNNTLQSRILLISASPSTDLAHQYIPIMNAIFACQRLSIPIDILQLPLTTLPTPTPTQNLQSDDGSGSNSKSSDSTVFLQQAADATHGIFIPAELQPPTPSSSSSSGAASASASQAFLTYLLLSFLPSPMTRSRHLILPTRIDVDFRAACFCHRNVVSVGFVCSICLSIFCSVPENGDCLTCGTHLTVGHYGARPVVVAKKTKKKQAAAGR
ncbi:RNA polymerase II transcription factor B subunit 4 [Exophiala xenobiotica]|nr:RNA polymerase II transcription factor B subunit 4 [Exophiala xenobiotica]KAK5216354.1 RNA polymerase II transcription factor B subunit 4 [Exophiala xenobiotica]KAK5289076.1 RNA polymerase II transcription factor B subunit 4 [Exophiala xenobiotica]KAK5422521.1 RNA polymerase II transcription factor B subunit 4 [Exophiala xenobiotica]KAK5473641.1 RNA polymerase II transcription factor B subunit 4 [Exophiala xenobiotica]